jgi:hypothetical protein
MLCMSVPYYAMHASAILRNEVPYYAMNVFVLLRYASQCHVMLPCKGVYASMRVIGVLCNAYNAYQGIVMLCMSLPCYGVNVSAK